MPKAIIYRSQEDDHLYLRPHAARLAGVSEDFLIQCEQEGLIISRKKSGGGTGFDRKSLQRITLIHRLHQDLALDLEVIELVLHLRRQIIELQDQLEAVKRRSQKKERQLIAEMKSIKRTVIQEGRINPEE